MSKLTYEIVKENGKFALYFNCKLVNFYTRKDSAQRRLKKLLEQEQLNTAVTENVSETSPVSGSVLFEQKQPNQILFLLYPILIKNVDYEVYEPCYGSTNWLESGFANMRNALCACAVAKPPRSPP